MESSTTSTVMPVASGGDDGGRPRGSTWSANGRPRVVVLEEDQMLGPCHDRLDEDLTVIARLPLATDLSRLHVVLAVTRPKLLLLKASLDSVDYHLMMLCFIHRVAVLVLARPGYGLLGPTRLHRLGALPWLRLRWPQERAGMLVKRLADVMLVVLSAPLLLPLLLALAAVASLDGPPLYFQHRVGAGGRLFRLVKIRTMAVGIERTTGPILASTDDPRVTPLGRVMRRYRLDEMPQLWNVLRGQMSLVGPRPERPEFVTQFRQLPLYDLRHLIRPGLTGIAQLTGGYAATVEDKLRCDLLYVGSRSLRLDLMLLVQTVFDMLRGFPRG
jgi:lipopolysaccharide/colanic/teichoic acid biosynthesis glycosyltransferase